MNKNMFVSKMKLFGDTVVTLATAIGCSPQRLSAKINNTHGAEFTQGEIQSIKEKYLLTNDEVEQIFFTSSVSWKDTANKIEGRWCNLNDVLYTVKEVATLLKSNVDYVHKLRKARLLKFIKIGSFKVRKQELDKFLELNEGKDISDPFNVKELEEN